MILNERLRPVTLSTIWQCNYAGEGTAMTSIARRWSSAQAFATLVACGGAAVLGGSAHSAAPVPTKLAIAPGLTISVVTCPEGEHVLVESCDATPTDLKVERMSRFQIAQTELSVVQYEELLRRWNGLDVNAKNDLRNAWCTPGAPQKPNTKPVSLPVVEILFERLAKTIKPNTHKQTAGDGYLPKLRGEFDKQDSTHSDNDESPTYLALTKYVLRRTLREHDGKLPVMGLSPDEARLACGVLSLALRADEDKRFFTRSATLPTGKQWQYACRATIKEEDARKAIHLPDWQIENRMMELFGMEYEEYRVKSEEKGPDTPAAKAPTQHHRSAILYAVTDDKTQRANATAGTAPGSQPLGDSATPIDLSSSHELVQILNDLQQAQGTHTDKRTDDTAYVDPTKQRERALVLLRLALRSLASEMDRVPLSFGLHADSAYDPEHGKGDRTNDDVYTDTLLNRIQAVDHKPSSISNNWGLLHMLDGAPEWVMVNEDQMGLVGSGMFDRPENWQRSLIWHIEPIEQSANSSDLTTRLATIRPVVQWAFREEAFPGLLFQNYEAAVVDTPEARQRLRELWQEDRDLAHDVLSDDPIARRLEAFLAVAIAFLADPNDVAHQAEQADAASQLAAFIHEEPDSISLADRQRQAEYAAIWETLEFILRH